MRAADGTGYGADWLPDGGAPLAVGGSLEATSVAEVVRVVQARLGLPRIVFASGRGSADGAVLTPWSAPPCVAAPAGRSLALAAPWNRFRTIAEEHRGPSRGGVGFDRRFRGFQRSLDSV